MAELGRIRGLLEGLGDLALSAFLTLACFGCLACLACLFGLGFVDTGGEPLVIVACVLIGQPRGEGLILYLTRYGGPSGT